jgi:uncharacterized protein YdhG (YjbR/CyaY superfamily)
MTSSSATKVTEYLASLPPERRKVVAQVRSLIRKHLPHGYREAMSFGMIGYELPLARYPETYNGKPLVYAALAAQKNAYSLYLTCAYMDERRVERLRRRFAAAGLRLDMGKSCIRFKRYEDLEPAAIAEEIASTPPEEFIRRYEEGRSQAATNVRPSAQRNSRTGMP